MPDAPRDEGFSEAVEAKLWSQLIEKARTDQLEANQKRLAEDGRADRKTADIGKNVTVSDEVLLATIETFPLELQPALRSLVARKRSAAQLEEKRTRFDEARAAIPEPDSKANPDEASRAWTEYFERHKAWQRLPFWKRTITKPPQQPTGV